MLIERLMNFEEPIRPPTHVIRTGPFFALLCRHPWKTFVFKQATAWSLKISKGFPIGTVHPHYKYLRSSIVQLLCLKPTYPITFSWPCCSILAQTKILILFLLNDLWKLWKVQSSRWVLIIDYMARRGKKTNWSQCAVHRGSWTLIAAMKWVSHNKTRQNSETYIKSLIAEMLWPIIEDFSSSVGNMDS